MDNLKHSVTRILTTWAAFMQGRKVTFAALLSTAFVSVILLVRADQDAAILLTRFDLSPERIRAAYAGLLVVTLVAFVSEPRIRAELADGKGTALVVFLAGAAAWWAVRLNIPDQTQRLIVYPFSLWWVILHVITLAVLAVVLVLDHPWTFPSRRAQRYALVAAAALGLVMAYWHVASVGRFSQLDLPDEPWVASNATHFAQTGRVSPVFIASTFGDPDPVMPRYYAVMGLWVRLVGSSLTGLRAFPLLVAGTATLIVAFTLWRLRALTWHQRAIGLAAYIGFSFFVRASHSLRMDIGLGLYGALVFMGLALYLQDDSRRARWPLFLGAALYVGLDTTITVSLLFGVSVGLALIAHSVKQPRCWQDWQHTALYVAVCTLALLVYGVVHFWPDTSTNWRNYQEFASFYSTLTFFNGMQALRGLYSYTLRFSLILSPVEAAIVLGSLGWLARTGPARDRLLVGVAVLGQGLIVIFISASFSYLVLFGPIIAYAAARACRSRLVTALGAFVLLPALLSAPIHDMVYDTRENFGAREIAEADLLTWQIPEQVTVVGESIFWYTLHDRNHFIGWDGVQLYAERYDMTQSEALDAVGVDVVICFELYAGHCDAVDSEKFQAPTDFRITRGNYLVYRRSPAYE